MRFASTIRFAWCDKTKRKKFPAVLSASEIRQLIAGLALRERTLVLLDAGTGLRMSELFALKWRDINFQSRDQCHTVDRVSGSWTMRDRGVPETDSARCLPSGSAEEMAGAHTLPKTR
jgi:integrase